MRVSAYHKAYVTVAISFLGFTNALYEDGSVLAPCDSPLYCHGSILRQIELARPFKDSKTFVDMPTLRPLDKVIEAFNELQRPIQNNTELNDFLRENFGQAGSELAPVPQNEIITNPQFLHKLTDPEVHGFFESVLDVWPNLTRKYVGTDHCEGCVNSYVPLRGKFVIAGGRFREPYYWDSFFIMEGLLRTKGSYTDISRNMIENFLDMVDRYGFVPNGARIYYLNRSQPPLLAQMVRIYIEHTGDYGILDRALPLLEKEHDFWMTNRSITLAVGSESWTLNHYAVRTNQPRPESFREDWQTAHNESFYAESGKIYPETHQLSESERATLYQNLASGAESGWDYSSRWLRTPTDAASDTYFPLRSLNTAQIVPVDLNSILYMNERTISRFHQERSNFTAAADWSRVARQRKDAMTRLLWSESHFSYYDLNLTSMTPNIHVPVDANAADTETSTAPPGYQSAFNGAQFYPFWTGAAPARLQTPTAMRRIYARVEARLNANPGAVAATNLVTTQQWDEPNIWPPLQYILIQGLLNTAAPEAGDGPEARDAYAHTQTLARRLMQRYLASAFCTWRATGGTAGALDQLPDAPPGAHGVLFEKYSQDSVEAAGMGGEYEVVEGFGWSNGVLIWGADVFGDALLEPVCEGGGATVEVLRVKVPGVAEEVVEVGGRMKRRGMGRRHAKDMGGA